MNRYDIRKRVGWNRKSMGDTGGTGMRWQVYDTETDVGMKGFLGTECQDGTFIRKRDAVEVMNLLNGNKANNNEGSK